ncbi:MAG: histidinol-phosphate transaminase [Betaproteobacteria bacterium]|nr:histidinol-phosphate transaminase [Pseudomonadota bacterium]NBO03309.1 histidinol-phosphate transaminase [Betaproteobacteria bacterium]NBO94928.1 histidinol-phosphate transaminase [Betaproteobacteria bacterium]NBP35446.1 histidinol-phosphate transaminase [Betaproteobacteria bacterium]NBP39299.1 histidinol-phosphate transaminase [Betaproteobacteria bacterium]
MTASRILDQSPAYVRAISPYRAGKPIEELAREYGLNPQAIVKLASNENPLGIPASALAAMQAAAADLGRYPDSNGFELKTALAKKHRVPSEWITLGNGSNDVLELAARAFLQPGLASIYAQHSFAVYALATQAIGARHVVVPAKDLGHDLDAMVKAIDADTRIIFVANPNNPTGTFLEATRIDAMLKQIPPQVAVVLDEAYSDYLPPQVRMDSVAWVRNFPNLIVSRTLSKAYGLAGLRIGYAIAQESITDLMNRLRQPFNVNSLALAAATAALEDDAFLAKSYALNRQGLEQLQSAFNAMQLPYLPSYANFVLVKVGNAAAVYESLLRAGVIVRPVANYGLPEWLRVSVGLPEENEAFLAALANALHIPAPQSHTKTP